MYLYLSYTYCTIHSHDFLIFIEAPPYNLKKSLIIALFLFFQYTLLPKNSLLYFSFYPSACFTHGRMRRRHVKKEFKEEIENENSGCLPFNLFVTSKNEFSNTPFLQFTNLKCCKMSLKSKNKA